MCRQEDEKCVASANGLKSVLSTFSRMDAVFLLALWLGVFEN